MSKTRSPTMQASALSVLSADVTSSHLVMMWALFSFGATTSSKNGSSPKYSNVFTHRERDLEEARVTVAPSRFSE